MSAGTKDPEDEAIVIGRAIVAAGWVWAPGQVMLMIVEHGDSRTVIPAVVTVLYEGVPISATHLGGGLGVVGEMVPDMRDPGTRGHAAMRPRHCAECWLFLTPGQVLDGWAVHPGCEPDR